MTMRRIVLVLLVTTSLAACSTTPVASLVGQQASGAGEMASRVRSGPQRGVQETLIFDGRQMPTGWSQASDPDLVKLNDTQWWMFFSSIGGHGANKKIMILGAYLPIGKGLDAEPLDWTILQIDGKVVPAIHTGYTKEAWDFDTVETARYVEGYDRTAGEWVKRIYFTGWRTLADGRRDYRIGFAQWNGNDWVKYTGNPVLTGSHPWETFRGRSLVGDQAIHYEPGPNGTDGLWHMWYHGNSDTAVVIGHATSTDGITWPAAQRQILPTTWPYGKNPKTPSGPYHLDVARLDGAYAFVGWMASPHEVGMQGLWMTTSSTPDGRAADSFATWYPLVYENNGVRWHDSGLTGSTHHQTGLFGATLEREGSTLWLYYHGVRKEGSNVASIGRATITGVLQ